METKPLLYGLIGFFIGGLLVSVAANTFDKTELQPGSDDSMTHMTATLKEKTGDEFDKAFIESMIKHHEGAVEMAKLADTKAKHDEIKQLSKAIILAQEKEIGDMRRWQDDWGYEQSHAEAVGNDMNH